MGSVDSTEPLPEEAIEGELDLTTRARRPLAYCAAVEDEPVVDPEEDDYDARNPENVIPATQQEIVELEQSMLSLQIRRFEKCLSSRPLTAETGEVNPVLSHYHRLLQQCKGEAMQLSFNFGGPQSSAGEPMTLEAGEPMTLEAGEHMTRQVTCPTTRSRGTTSGGGSFARRRSCPGVQPLVRFDDVAMEATPEADGDKTPTGVFMRTNSLYMRRRSQHGGTVGSSLSPLDLSGLNQSLLTPSDKYSKFTSDYDLDAGSTTDEEYDMPVMGKRKSQDHSRRFSPRKSPCSSHGDFARQNSPDSPTYRSERAARFLLHAAVEA